MARNRRLMSVSADAVWRTLSDGFTFDRWVVGTRHIRDVDDGFPATGRSLHYRIGPGPLRHEGHTEVLAQEAGSCLELRIHAWPAGTIRVVLRLQPRGEQRCEVTMEEFPDSGFARLMHNRLFDLGIRLRNVETLRRLERVAAGG